MQIRDLSKPVTSKALNESLAKRFGFKINLEQFSDVQLEDARNKLRTKLSQFEVNESFDSIHESPDYQKTRMFLDCINQEITEREEQKLAESSAPVQEEDSYKLRKDESVYYSTIRQKAAQYAVPDSWIKSAINRIQLGESDQEELSAELTLRYDLTEGQANHILYLSEGESDKAEIIMATKDMVDRVTGWLEDVAAMKAEQLLELLDSIRETLGSDVAQQYQDAIKPALEGIYSSLETSRQGITNALAVVSGEEGAPMMGAGAAAPAGVPGGEELPPLPGEGEEGTPPALEMGREKRESVDYSRRLGMLLAASKKK